MITCNGILGFSLLVGALRRHVAIFQAGGTGTALATVLTLPLQPGAAQLPGGVHIALLAAFLFLAASP